MVPPRVPVSPVGWPREIKYVTQIINTQRPGRIRISHPLHPLLLLEPDPAALPDVSGVFLQVCATKRDPKERNGTETKPHEWQNP